MLSRPISRTCQPPTFDVCLHGGLLHALGGRLVEARITHTDGQTIYASAVVSGCHGTQVVDSRPSDMINLALRVGAPIRVDPAVLDTMRVPDSQAEPPGIEWA